MFGRICFKDRNALNFLEGFFNLAFQRSCSKGCGSVVISVRTFSRPLILVLGPVVLVDIEEIPECIVEDVEDRFVVLVDLIAKPTLLLICDCDSGRWAYQSRMDDPSLQIVDVRQEIGGLFLYVAKRDVDMD